MNYDCLNDKTYLFESENVEGSNIYYFLRKEMEIFFLCKIIKKLKPILK